MSLPHAKRLAGMLVAAAWLGLGMACAPAAAQEGAKIGFVNTERLLRDAAPAKALQQRLESEFARRDRDLQDMATRFKTLSEQFERDAAGQTLTDADRTRRQRELADLDRDYQRRQREFREDLNQRRNEEYAQLIDKANRVIRTISEREKYDIILQEAVVASPRIDITEKVLRELNNVK